jgi:hypothetical protein
MTLDEVSLAKAQSREESLTQKVFALLREKIIKEMSARRGQNRPHQALNF